MKLITILCFCLAYSCSSYSQYFIKLLDEYEIFENDIVNGLLLDESGVWIATERARLVQLDHNGDLSDSLLINNLYVSTRGFTESDDKFYVYGYDKFHYDDTIRLNIFDKATLDQKSLTFGNSTFDDIEPLRIAVTENSIYLTYREFLQQSSTYNTKIKRLDIEGNELWDKSINELIYRTINYQLLPLDNDEVILGSSTTFDLQRPNQVARLDKNGNKSWEYFASESTTDRTTAATCVLNDWNILTTSIVDRSLDPEYLLNEWNDLPIKFTLLTPEGLPIRDSIYHFPSGSIQDLWALQKGNGDYCYGYGSWRFPDSEIDHPWIIKIFNDGEILWDRKYELPIVNSFQSAGITEIVENADGDITAVGTLWDPAWPIPFIIRTNENGCVDEECNELILETNDTKAVHANLIVYPNPVINEIYFNIPLTSNSQILISDMNGRLVLSKIINETKPEICNLSSGMYHLQLITNGGKYNSTFYKL